MIARVKEPRRQIKDKNKNKVKFKYTKQYNLQRFSIEIYATNAKDTQYSTIMANFACMPKN